MRATDSSFQPATKATLVAVSHAIEAAALAEAEDGPLVVFALFQRHSYFERERAVYRRIVRRAATTVVGVVDPVVSTADDQPVMVRIDERSELAREWSLIVLTPRFGASLVAFDREEVAGHSSTLEAGRLFDASVRFRRDEALHQVLRLERAVSEQLPTATRAAIAAAVERARDVPPAPGEARHEASLVGLTRRVERGYARRWSEAARADRTSLGGDEPDDAALGLRDEAFLRRWAGEDGVTASGTLPVGLVGVRVAQRGTLPDRYGRRLAGAATIETLRFLQGLLGPADRAVRLTEDEFLLVLPTRPYSDTVALAYRIVAEVDAIVARNQAVGAAAVTAAVGVTRQRPLPLDEVRQALAWAAANSMDVVSLPGMGELGEAPVAR